MQGGQRAACRADKGQHAGQTKGGQRAACRAGKGQHAGRTKGSMQGGQRATCRADKGRTKGSMQGGQRAACRADKGQHTGWTKGQHARRTKGGQREYKAKEDLTNKRKRSELRLGLQQWRRSVRQMRMDAATQPTATFGALPLSGRAATLGALPQR
eukprot:364758-Chlamydomonas_euryale.AAC.3